MSTNSARIFKSCKKKKKKKKKEEKKTEQKNKIK